MGIFSRKSFEDHLASDVESGFKSLKRVLGATDLVMLGVSATLGAGIYTLLVTTVSHHTGPAISLSFVLAGISCALTALCYAELAAMLPVAGSAYTYATHSIGELCAWVIGWDLLLEYTLGAATAAAGWSLIASPILAQWGWPDLAAGGVNIIALMIVTVLTVLLLIGIRESARFNSVIVVIKLGVVALFIALGFQNVSWANLTPFIPPNTGQTGEFGWSGVFQGAGIMYFAYIGFDAVATTAEEAKNPERTLPIGILGALLISTIVYVLFSLVLVGSIPFSELKPSLTDSYQLLFSPLVAYVLTAGTLLGLLPVVLVMLLGQSRVMYAMAKDGLLPSSFANVHPRFRTPFVGTIVTGVATGLAATFLPLESLAKLTSVGTLFAFTVVCVAVLVLRYTDPDRPRLFRVPFVPVLPITACLINLWLGLSIGITTVLRLGVWLAIGLLFYVAYGRRHSRISRQHG